jgi:hypothetical protein
MNAIPPHERPSWIRRHRTLVFWLTSSLLFVLFILGLGWLQRYRTQRQIDGKLAAIRAQGLPANFHELNDYYAAVPDADNAALLFTQAHGQITDWDLGDNWIGVGSNSVLYATNPITPFAKTTLQGFITSNQNALKLIYEGTAKTKSRYPVDLRQGIKAPLTHLFETKQALLLLRLESIHHLAEGRKQQALLAVESSMRISRTLDHEPLLISFLVRNAFLTITLNNLEQLMGRSEFAAADLLRIQETIAAAEHTTDLRRVLHGERAYVIGSGNEPLSQIPNNNTILISTPFDTWPKPFQRLALQVYDHGGYAEADLLNTLVLFEELDAISVLSPSDTLEKAKEIEARFPQSKPSMANILTTQFAGSVLSVFKKEIALFARLRIAQTALALERFRLENGNLPKELNALVPQFLKILPLDPFTNKPLHYRVTYRGFRVYSTGENGQDDGGLTRSDEPKPDKNDDIVFAVERSTSLTQP